MLKYTSIMNVRPRKKIKFSASLSSEHKNQIIRLISLIVIALTSLAVLLFADFPSISDRIKAFDYTPTKEMSILVQDLRLTRRAKTILNAARPAIYTEDVFNKYCQTKRSQFAVLGCYTDDTIYLYDVQNIDLVGVKQATLAHEFLHAVWARTPKSTREELISSLNKIYEANQDKLKERLETYPEEDWNNELHSIIGTEIALYNQAACPQSSCESAVAILRAHYSKYFNDQSSVVAFYSQYRSKFSELEDEAAQIYEQISINQELVQAQSKNCEDGIDELNIAIADFNRRTGTSAIASNAVFQAERAELLRQQEQLERAYKELENLVNDTNRLIEKYNNNIAQTQGLLSSIDSNADKNINKIKED